MCQILIFSPKVVSVVKLFFFFFGRAPQNLSVCRFQLRDLSFSPRFEKKKKLSCDYYAVWELDKNNTFA